MTESAAFPASAGGLRIDPVRAECIRTLFQQIRNSFAAASHDLRQPLHALSLFSGSLQSLALDAEAKDVAARIQSNVAAMEKLFNGLLDISRLEAGVVQSHREPMSCQDLFDRLAG